MVERRISVIGTEAYHENVPDSEDRIAEIARQIRLWWRDEIETESDEYNALVTWFPTLPIPESELGMSSLSSRRHNASQWLADNILWYNGRASIQILDWVEETGVGWPLGNAALATAMTTSVFKTGITNMYRFESPPYYFQEVDAAGTAFHELLHNYDVRHRDGGTNCNNEASFILSALKDADDDSCHWFSDSHQRTEWTTSCTTRITHDHINNNS